MIKMISILIDQGPEHCQSLLRMRAAVRTLLYDLQLQIEKNFAAGTLVSKHTRAGCIIVSRQTNERTTVRSRLG